MRQVVHFTMPCEAVSGSTGGDEQEARPGRTGQPRADGTRREKEAVPPARPPKPDPEFEHALRLQMAVITGE